MNKTHAIGQLPKIKGGYRVGKLTVEEKTKQHRQGYTVWCCRCDCGNFHEVTSSNLKNGSVSSGGCINTARQ